MKTSPDEWDRRFMCLAVQVSSWSKDPDEGVGAVVVAPGKRQFSVGYNGLPKGHDDCLSVLLDKDLKNRLTIHAERNALDNAPFDLTGATLYVTKPPCTECMKGIIQKGVKAVVCAPMRLDSRWLDDQRFARSLAASSGVTVREREC